MPQDIRLTDGQFSFSGGVQSDASRQKRTAQLTDGVLPNQLAWGVNCVMRGGKIGQRPALDPLVQNAPWSGLYQGGIIYEPDFADQFLLLAIGGQIYKVRVDADNSITNLSSVFGFSMPADLTHFFIRQSEMFAVIQCGDLSTLPLFYDAGVPTLRPELLRRSAGIVNPGVSDPDNELPAAGPMSFYAQRMWYAYNRGYAAGDISGSTFSGSAPFGFRDSVIKVTENPVAYAGDGFGVPTTAGNIRALDFASNIDSSLGDAQLFVFTRRAVYSCVAPITRDDWTAATNSLQPLQKLILDQGGSYGDRSVVKVNGDMFFQSPPNGDVRSIQATLRYQQQWGYVPLSNNINRLTAVNNRSLLSGATGINFDNRLLMSALPVMTPSGIAHKALSSLDFDIISTLEERRPPAWEGAWDFSGGPFIMDLFSGDFGGRQRAFAVVWSDQRQAIEVWEIRPDILFDSGENRITREIEFPSFTFNDVRQLKDLETGVLWLENIRGTVNLELFYRPDGFGCWYPWFADKVCAAKNCAEQVDNPCLDTGYPLPDFCSLDGIPIRFPVPVSPPGTPNATGNYRPANIGYSFQLKLRVKGACDVRGVVLYSKPRFETSFYGISLNSTPSGL